MSHRSRKRKPISELRKLVIFTHGCKYLSSLSSILIVFGLTAIYLSPLKFYYLATRGPGALCPKVVHGILISGLMVCSTYMGLQLLRRLDIRFQSLQKLEVPQCPTCPPRHLALKR